MVTNPQQNPMSHSIYQALFRDFYPELDQDPSLNLESHASIISNIMSKQGQMGYLETPFVDFGFIKESDAPLSIQGDDIANWIQGLGQPTHYLVINALIEYAYQICLTHPQQSQLKHICDTTVEAILGTAPAKSISGTPTDNDATVIFTVKTLKNLLYHLKDPQSTIELIPSAINHTENARTSSFTPKFILTISLLLFLSSMVVLSLWMALRPILSISSQTLTSQEILGGPEVTMGTSVTMEPNVTMEPTSVISEGITTFDFETNSETGSEAGSEAKSEATSIPILPSKATPKTTPKATPETAPQATEAATTNAITLDLPVILGPTEGSIMTAKSTEITWQPVTHATSYKIDIMDTMSWEKVFTTEYLEGTSYKLDTSIFQVGGKYKLYLFPCIGTSQYEPATLELSGPELTPPQIISPQNGSNLPLETLLIQWETPTKADTFKIVITDTYSWEQIKVYDQYTNNTLEVSSQILTLGRPYRIYVSQIKNNIESAPSYVDIQIEKLSPPKITNPTPNTTQKNEGLTVQWLPVPDVKGYLLTVTNLTTWEVIFKSETHEQTTMIIPPDHFASGETYRIYLQSIGGDDYSEPSIVDFTLE